MLYAGRVSRWGFFFNKDYPLTHTGGTTVTPGTSNADGSWVQLASGADVTSEVWALALHQRVTTSSSAASQARMFSLALDLAGGTSYTTPLITNMLMQVGERRPLVLPLRIPAGASVGMRARSAHTVARTTQYSLSLFGRPSRPEQTWCGHATQVIGGVAASSKGTDFVPGNGSYGSWTSLGTATRRLRSLWLAISSTDSTLANKGLAMELAYGDGTNYVRVGAPNLLFLVASTEAISGTLTYSSMSLDNVDIPAGATLYVRGRSSTTLDSNYNAAVLGVG